MYLNLDFILRFGCIRPKDQMGDDYLNWLILSRSLIRNHIELNKLDTNSFNAVSLNKDEFIRFVSSNNNSEIELSATIDVNKAREFILKNYNPHMLLLLETDKETIEQLQCEFGIWVMNTSTLLNSFLGTKNGIGVPNNVNRTTGHIKSWDFLSQFKHPFGGIIIVDRLPRKS